MKINYLKAIIDNHYFNELSGNSTSDNKQFYVKLFQSALAFIKTKNYIWDDGFVDPTFIQWGIEWVDNNDDECIESQLNEYVTHITRLMNDFDGYWFKQEIINILEDEHYFSENFAITAMVYAIHGLTENNDRFLYLATRCESFMYFAEVAAKSLLRAEELVEKRDQGREKSRAKRSSKSVLERKIDELAKEIWQELPELSNLSVATNIHSGISNILTSYIGSKTKCQAFYELGLYEEVLTTSEKAEDGIEHPDDFNLSCIPLKLKTPDAIRKQITLLKPSGARKNNSSAYIKKIKPILKEKLPCSNPKCECRKKF